MKIKHVLRVVNSEDIGRKVTMEGMQLFCLNKLMLLAYPIPLSRSRCNCLLVRSYLNLAGIEVVIYSGPGLFCE